MRIIAIAVAALSIALFHRSAEAQSFWYVPPGYGYGYSQDLGNGVGFGYGIGAGVPFTLDHVTTASTPNSGQLLDGTGDWKPANIIDTHTVSQPKLTKKASLKATVMQKKGPSAPIAKGVNNKGAVNKNALK